MGICNNAANSDKYHRVCRRNGLHWPSAAVVTEYYATATTTLCAPPARVLEFGRFLHTPPRPPSEPRLPSQPTRFCSHPIPGSHSSPPHAAASITTTVQNRPPITALTPCAHSPLLLFAGTCSQLHPARPRSRPGGTQRHPFLRNTIFWGCLPNYDSQPQLRNPNIIIRRSVCGNLPVRVSSLKLRPTSAADAVVQTTIESPTNTPAATVAFPRHYLLGLFP